MKTYKATLPNVDIHASCDVLVHIEADTPEEALKKLKAGDFTEKEFSEIWGDCMDMPKYHRWVGDDNNFDFAELIEEVGEDDDEDDEDE